MSSGSSPDSQPGGGARLSPPPPHYRGMARVPTHPPSTPSHSSGRSQQVTSGPAVTSFPHTPTPQPGGSMYRGNNMQVVPMYGGYSQSPMPSLNILRSQQIRNPMASEIHIQCQMAHARLMGLQTALNRQSGSPLQNVAGGIIKDTREVGKGLVTIGKLASDLSAETDGLQASIRELQTKVSGLLATESRMKEALAERDRLALYVNTLKIQVSETEKETSEEREKRREIGTRLQNATERIELLEKQLKSTGTEDEASEERERCLDLMNRLQGANDRIELLEQQLQGKRSLWYSAQKDPRVQNMAIESVLHGNANFVAPVRRAQSPSPSHLTSSTGFSSSSYASASSSGSGWNSSSVSNGHGANGKVVHYGKVSGFSTKSVVPHSGPNLARPHSVAPATRQIRASSHYGSSGVHSPATFQSPPSNAGGPEPSNALVLRGQDNSAEDPVAQKWAKQIAQIFNAVDEWIVAYIAPQNFNVINDCRSNKKLWDYMCSVTYPGRPQEGDSHSVYLLRKEVTRKFFVKRLMVQHIVRSIWSIDIWLGFDKETDSALKGAEYALRNTELFRTHERQGLVETQGRIVKKIMESETFAQFRQKKNNAMTEQFKQILSSLMNPGASREKSVAALNDIVWLSFETSANMFMSSLHFGFVWNDTCTKFSHESHVACNHYDMNGMELQIRQFRLMLVITPGITVRDDRGMNIIPRRVMKSQVLVMP